MFGIRHNLARMKLVDSIVDLIQLHCRWCPCDWGRDRDRAKYGHAYNTERIGICKLWNGQRIRVGARIGIGIGMRMRTRVFKPMCRVAALFHFVFNCPALIFAGDQMFSRVNSTYT